MNIRPSAAIRQNYNDIADMCRKKMCIRDRVVDLPVLDNTVMAKPEKAMEHGMFSAKKAKEICQKYIRELLIKTPSEMQKAKFLSGGNQQKVVLAKWLNCEPEIIVLDEPTRGIDVNAKMEIYNIIVKLAEEGKDVYKRQVRYALDYEVLNQSITGGYGSVATQGAVSPSCVGYLDGLEAVSYTHLLSGCRRSAGSAGRIQKRRKTGFCADWLFPLSGDNPIQLSGTALFDLSLIHIYAFDGRGNYALGIKEQLIFPEIEYDKVDKVRGMDVIFVTTAKTDEEARELLKLFNMPFAK